VKYIFLDIDGVVNSSRSVIVKMGPTIETSEKVRELARLDEEDFANGIAGGQDMRNSQGLEYAVKFGLMTVDPICVALINKLIEGNNGGADDIGIVLSSSHRQFLCHSKVPFRSPEHLRRLRMYLVAMGFAFENVYLSATPVAGGIGKIRGDEIDEWLNLAWESGLYDDGDPYVILDDAADMHPGQPLVLVNPEHGFSFANYAECCKLLGLKEPGLILL